MKITTVHSFRETIPLRLPFTIADNTNDSATLHFLKVQSACGLTGLGSASPSKRVTGESHDSCAAALKSLDFLKGEDARNLPRLLREAATALPNNPAARAALDMALHDLLAQRLEVPLTELLGRCHTTLPTSITLGIRSLDETLAEAQENNARGFGVFKVKLGKSLEEDLEKLRRLREVLPEEAVLRVDSNQGYTLPDLQGLLACFDELRLEFIEQPLPVSATDDLLKLSPEQRQWIALDETLQSERDALRFGFPERYCGIYNIKIMKSGGLEPARRIAQLAELGNIALMWGCNDESCVSLAAALHLALACPNTRYLDLDGDLDLVRDPAVGGYEIRNGVLHLSNASGLGVRLR